MIVPLTTRGRRLDRDTTLLLLLHEICGGFAVVNFTGFMNLTGQFQNSFCGGGLARVNVGEDTDIAVLGEVGHVGSHEKKKKRPVLTSPGGQCSAGGSRQESVADAANG